VAIHSKVCTRVSSGPSMASSGGGSGSGH